MLGRILMVAFGGSLGAVSRYAVTHFVNLAFPGTVVSHWGTLTVNLAGSFLIGILFSTVQGVPHFNHLWLFFAVGFMGAFTTFSSYALEMHNQLAAGIYKDAALNFLLNNIGAVVMVFAGIFLVKMIKG
ncbi:MAG: putative fluoride ion transporter CrcB [Candidatus Aerophobetes bacterium ADurb.Bin490]|nr:MAG: putative fluoride ion transporter CrcB [Candidatus Aerophobetes bacterium ADurb.Bin490]